MLAGETLELLISERRIRSRVADIAERIDSDYHGEPPSLVVVLKGAYMFAADLVRRIEIPCTVDFITATSYGKAARSSGRVTIRGIDRLEVTGRRVLVVEDILDTGLTGAAIFDQLTPCKPADIMFCTLLRKPKAVSRGLPVLYKGFDIPDDFVIGYGMDYAERYRNLRDIHRLIFDGRDAEPEADEASDRLP